MKITGIIAEYNPFHSGHAYHISRARDLTGADYVVVVMSPDFVQRGEPAILDKYTRAEMALHGGADLVLELPVRFALGSAPYFAAGGTGILDRTGCVDYLCFGCETPRTDLMQAAAGLLYDEPEAFKADLRRALSEGFSFPQAREHALFSSMNLSDSDAPALHDILSSPNNILALSYLKALKELGSSICPVPVMRRGDGYHTASVSSGAEHASASALRRILRNGNVSAEELRSFIPEEPRRILHERVLAAGLPSPSALDALLGYALMTKESYAGYLDATPELDHRIRHELSSYDGFESFSLQLNTRAYTHSRVRRVLMHILLGIRENPSPASYARILGFRKQSSDLLHKIRKNGSLRLISKAADAFSLLNENEAEAFKQDILASQVYRLLFEKDSSYRRESEYRRSPVIIS